ncbi:glycosyltransferase family 2 protein [Rhodococcus erythropolis]|uniref:Glycosyltransferase family 2 protein n=1 Tax=Rhodococcus erythropolis TaxID=1833 RepID=A0A8I0ZT00_RHOER|nr:glycosyltransferase family A protein [Rhodococcus erythropolis]MBH5141774.1 glycosyltransferase family 2 protein [Rhodococcus erythropolis]
MPQLSVVIPAYNNASVIAETMRTVLTQDMSDFELIVADHSSDDGTMWELEQFEDDPRVTLLNTPAGGGAQANWRRVSEAASGEYIKLVCGDDLLYPGLLSTQVEALDIHPTAVGVGVRRDILDARGRPVIRGRGLQGLRGLVNGADAIRRTIVEGTNVFGEPVCMMFRREPFEEAGGWDGRFPYLIDMTSYSNALIGGDFLALDQTLAGFRVSAAQWSVALVNEQAAQAKAYNRHFQERLPWKISRRDLWIGNRRAEVMAVERRTFYSVFRSRLQPRQQVLQ